MRPIDIARRLHISTSTLRYYEELGMLPPIQRSSTGYRLYTEEHFAYFECIRAMADGFGIALTAKILDQIHARDVHAAFWLVSQAQYTLYQDKEIAEKIMSNLQEHIPTTVIEQKLWTIHEVSETTGIPTTTIRHWEKIGLISIPRGEGNQYRLFSQKHLQQIVVIHALKTSLYSPTYSLNGIKQIIQELDQYDREKVRQIADDYKQHLDRINYLQMRGIRYLSLLCERLGLSLTE